MKCSEFFVTGGTALALIHFCNCDWMAESVILPTGALVEMVLEPSRTPWPIDFPGTLYSASWSMSGLTRMAAKNCLICLSICFDAGVTGQSGPQLIELLRGLTIGGNLMKER